MNTVLVVVLLSLVIVGLSFAGIGIKMLVKKNGEFKRHCSSIDPYPGERSGCVCAKTVYDKCDSAPHYHPLEVNKELLEECGNLPKQEKR